MKKTKWMIVITILVLILTGCTQKEETPKTKSLKDVPPGFCIGFEEAEFEKFNSIAPEEELLGSLVWLQGSYDNVSSVEINGDHVLYSTVVADDQNQWLVLLDTEELAPAEKYQEHSGDTTIIKATYIGYSDVFDLPAIFMIEMFDRDTGDFINSAAFSKFLNNTEEENTVPEQEESAPEPAEEDNETMRPEIKEAIDSYESFMDEYIAFMKKFDETDNTAALLLEYASFMSEYAQFSKKIEAMENDLNDAESIYYLEVMNRVNTKMLKELQ